MYQFVKYYMKRNNFFPTAIKKKKTLIGKWLDSQNRWYVGVYMYWLLLNWGKQGEMPARVVVLKF